jgi:AcrR family transcriptional regulator
MSLRDDKRRWTMREVQAAALDLFEAQGYEVVSVEAIAAAAGVSAPTVYRHFGSKERIVLWDDYDPDLLGAIAREARRLPPLAAIEAGLIVALDAVYETDAKRVLRRAKLVTRQPELRAANAPLMAELRAGLGTVLITGYPRLGDAPAELLAAVVVVALEHAVGRWVEARGKIALKLMFGEAFEDLRSVVLKEGVLT